MQSLGMTSLRNVEVRVVSTRVGFRVGRVVVSWVGRVVVCSVGPIGRVLVCSVWSLTLLVDRALAVRRNLCGRLVC